MFKGDQPEVKGRMDPVGVLAKSELEVAHLSKIEYSYLANNK